MEPHTFAVSDPQPCASPKRRLGCRKRIAQSRTLLPCPGPLTRVHTARFHAGVVVRALRGFPLPGVSQGADGLTSRFIASEAAVKDHTHNLLNAPMVTPFIPRWSSPGTSMAADCWALRLTLHRTHATSCITPPDMLTVLCCSCSTRRKKNAGMGNHFERSAIDRVSTWSCFYMFTEVSQPMIAAVDQS